jgi:hypothetical protein
MNAIVAGEGVMSGGETVAPNSRLGFGEASDAWLAGPVFDLRPATQAGYRSALDQHLRPRYGQRRLESVTADELAALVRDMRMKAKARRRSPPCSRLGASTSSPPADLASAA